MNFIGRRTELNQLKELVSKSTSSLVVIKGRRRIGKSRLIQEFARKFNTFFEFTGLAPQPGITSKDQKKEFSTQLFRQGKLPGIQYDDWDNLFFHLGQLVKNKKACILLDEISWMAKHDATFLPKLKNAWDSYFKRNPKLILVLCGSISSWIDQNILTHTGFLGRISLELTLKELPLSDCIKFLGDNSHHINAFEKLKILSITGGVPRYLEEIQPHLNAEQNIKRLCFRPNAILFFEFNRIFSDLFDNKAQKHKEIVQLLGKGKYTGEEISKKLAAAKGGTLSDYLENLQTAGFIQRDYNWHFENGQLSKLSKYRLKDNYLRFYLKYIEPNSHKIEHDLFDLASFKSLPNWDTTLGLQFENLVLNNRHKIFEYLNIYPGDIVFENPYFQTKTKQHAGCQIDYLIQTKFNTLYLCEIKFSKYPINTKIIPEIEKKIKTIKTPLNFSIRPVLITAAEVEEELSTQRYFAQIISFSDLLSDF